jgi:hypothetical protein
VAEMAKREKKYKKSLAFFMKIENAIVEKMK